MKYVWIAGRFFFAGAFTLCLGLSLGWHRPMISVFDVQEPVPGSVGATKSLLQQPAGESNNQELEKAEDLVADWEKPDVTLFLTGRQHGYIEPCGCITLARQKGGLMRRHRVQKILQSRGWDLVPLDAGNQVRRFAQQPVIKIGKTYEALNKIMGYEMVGLGPDDLKLPSTDMAQSMINTVGDKNPFTCANVVVIDQSLTNRFVVINKGGKRIGVTMVVGDEHLEKIASPNNVMVKPCKDALQEVVPQLKAAKCDFNVLMAFTSLDRCRELAKAFPTFDLLVTAGGAGDPTLEPEMVEAPTHVTPMVQVGVKGMYVGLIGIYQQQGRTRIKYKRVALTHAFKDTDEMKGVFLSYQNKLKAMWLSGRFDDIAERDHPTGRTFVGSDACADCHQDEYDIWLDGVDGDGGPHTHATDSLKQNPNDDRVWVQRHYDPECMSCHSTGWNPQNFYPYKSGLLDIDKQDHLHGNGCEGCHGPGSAHVELERAAAKGQQVDQTLLKQLRDDIDLTIAEARKSACQQCHDLDNSPDFLEEGGFDEYWPQVEHGDGDDE